MGGIIKNGMDRKANRRAILDNPVVEEQKKCFSYINLQPLWAEDNLKKSKKFFIK